MLYNPLNKQQLKNLRIVSIVIALLGTTLSFVCLLRNDFNLLIITIVVFSVILSCFLILYAIAWVIGQFRCEFCNDKIRFFWAKKCYRNIPYSKIKGISICGAVNYAYFPITDNNKRQLAIVSLYREAHIAAMRISPNATTRFPYGEDYCICRTKFNSADLATIMRCSCATAFVSQEIFSLYSSEMTKLFNSFPPDQVMISHLQLGCNHHVLSTYKEYLQGKSRRD